METNNYWTRRLRRRRFVQGAGAGVAGVATFALVGCGDDDDDDDGNGGADPTATTGNGGADPTATTGNGGSGGAGQPVYGGATVTVSTNVYDSVDGQRSVASPAIGILNYAQSKLLRFQNPNIGDLAPDLAEEWETPDATTVVLRIREGVTWQDQGPGAEDPAASPGRDLTLEDIQWNIERQKANQLADGTEASFGRNSYWAQVDSMDIAGQTLTLNLNRPNGAFVQGLANEFNLINQPELAEAYESTFSEIAANKVIGTGPFILTEWVPGERISAVKNPTYFLEDKPYMEARRWTQTFEDPTAYRIAFEQKQLDYFSDPDPTTTEAIAASNPDEIRLRFSGVANTVAIYLPRQHAPWNNDNLIKAIHLATNRRQIIQQLHNGLGKVSGPVAWLQEAWAIPDEELETIPGYRIDKEEDLTEARALWEAGGGPDIGEVTFVVPETWAARAGWGSSPELMANMFNEAFGTNQFKGATKGYGEIIPAWSSGDFDPFFGWIPNVEIPDARGDLAGAFKSDSRGNIWGINEPELVDAKIDASLESTDLEEAKQLLREVQDTALENGQWGRIILYNYIFPAAEYNYRHGLYPSPDEAWNFLAGSLEALETWIDPEDPSFQGRAEPDWKPL